MGMSCKAMTLDMTLKAINKHAMLWRQGKLSKLSGFGTGPGGMLVDCWGQLIVKKCGGGNQVLE